MSPAASRVATEPGPGAGTAKVGRVVGRVVDVEVGPPSPVIVDGGTVDGGVVTVDDVVPGADVEVRFGGWAPPDPPPPQATSRRARATGIAARRMNGQSPS